MIVEVKLFARARELAGADRVALELPEQAHVDDLRTALAVRCPQLASLAAGLLVSVGMDYANDRTRLFGDREIACFPPVSGG